ncbi:MAG: hypothetical protein AAF333_07490 [Planctomycetota bacterium]
MTETQAAELLLLVTAIAESFDVLLWWVVFGSGLALGCKLFTVCLGTASRSLYQW